ncbi:unnamed protein product [Nezara viridula]|nr:unnamed protein product [Nezara viridula]
MFKNIVCSNFVRPIARNRLLQIRLCYSSVKQILKEKIANYLDKPERLCCVWRNFLEWNPDLLGRGNEELINKLKQKMIEKSGGDINIEEELFYDLYIFDQIQVHKIITNYQYRGHLSASIDPLNILRDKFVPDSCNIPRKDLESLLNCPYNKERKIILPDESFIGGSQTVMKLKDILIRLNRSFCGSIGIEFMNHTSVDIRQWVKRKFEEPAFVQSMHAPNIKQIILLRLIRAHCFEQFVSSKWPNEKQHGAVGCEILMPALETLIDFGSAHGAQSFVLGMTTTRARLNVLANVFRKPLQQIFVPFHHQTSEGVLLHDDDKYVLGNNVKKVTSNQALPTEFAVLASTSNFVEAIDPLVSGKTMAEQLYTADDDGRRVWPIVIHGDEVISGQGIVLETFRLASQKYFSTNGTIHIVLTNQYNLPKEDSAKSDDGSIYATNVAHASLAPVFHVNSQDPEAVVYCMKVAAEYRAKFKS